MLGKTPALLTWDLRPIIAGRTIRKGKGNLGHAFLREDGTAALI